MKTGRLIVMILTFWLCSMARAGDVKVSVLVFGPGPASWERFGHIALRFQSGPQNLDVCYDWGRFDFDAAGFFSKFIMGDMRYSMGGADTARMLDVYKNAFHRTITEYDLNLKDDEIGRLIDNINWQNTEAHRYYQYDYYRNNCSTAVRDAIDDAVGGRLRPALEAVQTNSTFRSETRRLMPIDIANRLLLIGIEVGCGRGVDHKLNGFEESFVPMRLGAHLQNVVLHDADGSERRLVSETRVLNVTRLPGNFEPATASRPIWLTGTVGMLIAVGLILIRRHKRLTLITLDIVAALASAVAIFLLFTWLFTAHWVAGANENLLLFSPVWFVVLVGIIWKRFRVAARMAMLVIVALTIVALLMKFLPGNQANLPMLALAVPINLVGAIVLWKLKRESPKQSTVALK